MRLSFTTLGCPTWSWSRIVEQAAALGFDGIELRGVGETLYCNRIPEFAPERVADTVAGLRAAGLELICLDTSANYHDPAKWEGAVAEARDAIDLAQRTGSAFIRVQGDVFPTGEDRNETLARIIAGLRDACAHAAGTGVRVCLETHGDFTTVESVGALCEGVGPELSIIWDIEHVHRGCGAAWPAFHAAFADRIVHVHLKDATLDAEGRYHLCHSGAGDLPIRETVATLAAAGYQGYLSLEWEKRWVPSLPEPGEAFPIYVAHLRGLLAELGVAR